MIERDASAPRLISDGSSEVIKHWPAENPHMYPHPDHWSIALLLLLVSFLFSFNSSEMVNFAFLRKLKKSSTVYCEPSMNARSGNTTSIITPGSLQDNAGVKAFQQDPMRISKYPDALGSFIDPMGGRLSYAARTDVFTTGAWFVWIKNLSLFSLQV